jgi:hypothetical protein
MDHAVQHAGVNIAGFVSGIGATRVVFNRMQVVDNSYGFLAQGSSSAGFGPIVVQVRDSLVAGSPGNGIWPRGCGAVAGIVVDRTSAVGNAGF